MTLQAMESQGKFKEAEFAYTKAKETDSIVRLNLQNLDNPEKAFDLVRTTNSAEGGMVLMIILEN